MLMHKDDKFIFLQQTYLQHYPLLRVWLYYCGCICLSQNIIKSKILIRIYFQIALFINSKLQICLNKASWSSLSFAQLEDTRLVKWKRTRRTDH